MISSHINCTFNNFNNDEKSTVLHILNQYRFNIFDIQRINNEYRIATDRGIMLLKKTKHGSSRIRAADSLAEQLMDNNFNNIIHYIRTVDNSLFVEHKKYIYYMTQWIDAEEFHIYNIEEAMNCVKLLADFHKACSSIDLSKCRIKSNMKNWSKIFSSNLHELEDFKRTINKKRLKNEFDLCYLEHFEGFYSRGITALDILSKCEYHKLIKQVNEKRFICHEDFYYEHILKDKSRYVLNDVHNIIVDVYPDDLGKLFRKLISNVDYNYNFLEIKRLLDTYNSINELSVNQLEIMLAFVIFPYKFWKLGRRRYIKHKEWSEEKYTRKLKSLIELMENQEKFIAAFYNYIQNI